MTNPRPKFLDNHIANQIPFAGLERARGGRLLFLLHQPHVRHQVLFSTKNNLHCNPNLRDFFIKTLDDSASGIQAIMARFAER